jgi:hypothetical protein
MAYIRANYIDNNGRTNESAYTHIENYSINVREEAVTIVLVTYISQEAKDNQYRPIEREIDVIKEGEYDKTFGRDSLIPSPTSRDSDNLQAIYGVLNDREKWSGEGVDSVFEIMIKDNGDLKKDDEVSRKEAGEKGLVEGEDYEAVNEK